MGVKRKRNKAGISDIFQQLILDEGAGCNQLMKARKDPKLAANEA